MFQEVKINLLTTKIQKNGVGKELKNFVILIMKKNGVGINFVRRFIC